MPTMTIATANGGGSISTDGGIPVFLPNFVDEDVRALKDLVIQSQKDLLHVEESILKQDERTTAMEAHMRILEQDRISVPMLRGRRSQMKKI